VAIQAKGQSDDAQKPDPLLRDPNEKDAIQSKSLTANVLFIAGGVLAVGAGILGFTTKWSSSEPSTPRPASAYASERARTWSLAPWAGTTNSARGVPDAVGASAAGVF
jgi:hypothetical protein